MSHKWGSGYAEDGAIVISRVVDNAMNPMAQTINGGLDRENLPDDCIDAGRISPQQVMKVSIFSDLANTDVTEWPSPNEWTNNDFRGTNLAGLNYTALSGGGSSYSATTADVACEEGMLSVRWTCKCWVNTYDLVYDTTGTAQDFGQKAVYWIMKVDGTVVAQTRSYYMTFNNIKLETAIPVMKGTRQIEIVFVFADSQEGDYIYEAAPMTHWWGGNLTAMNRIR